MTSSPLLHTKSGRERIVVAIRWDERSDKTTIIDTLRGTNQQFDIDLTCFVYDQSGEYIDFVGPMAQDSVGQFGAIYHSGDDATGAGSGDDEFISVELANLPDDTKDIIFVAEIRSNHVFGQIGAPFVRLADGMTDKNLFEHPLTTNTDKDKKACVMIKIGRDSASPTGWIMQTIGEYPALEEVSDWGYYLVRYL